MAEPKQGGFEFWRNRLDSCQYVVAPMVDQSELAWRMLSRRYGAQLCYTPMFHSGVFLNDPNYRKSALQSCKEDRPLIIQFCGNNPEIFLSAAKIAEDYCEAIDINLGCPQMIAKRGHYGAFLQDEWDLLENIVSVCHKQLKVPITCKIRVFESIDKTVKYAKMLEKAGCQLLTVHGRTREMKGRETGLANWEYVKAIKKAVSIPVFSNGNIQYLSDVKDCINETGVEGIMTAEGNLHNPALFAGINPPIWQMCEEYLDLVEKYPCPLSYSRGHVFKILHHALHLHPDIRDRIGIAKSTSSLRTAIEDLKERCLEEMKDKSFNPRVGLFGELPLPYWYCQPYVRPSPEEAELNREKRDLLKRPLVIEHLTAVKGLSKKKVKKHLRNPHKNIHREKTVFEICEDPACENPKGQKCSYNLCKGCCRKRNSTVQTDCPGKGHPKTAKPLDEGYKFSASNPELVKRTKVCDAVTESNRTTPSGETGSDTTPSGEKGSDTTSAADDVTKPCDILTSDNEKSAFTELCKDAKNLSENEQLVDMPSKTQNGDSVS